MLTIASAIQLQIYNKKIQPCAISLKKHKQFTFFYFRTMLKPAVCIKLRLGKTSFLGIASGIDCG